MKDTRAAEQIYRVDGRNSFVEITAYGLSIDKVYINFVEYNKDAPAGQRMSASIGIYMNMFEANVLSCDIMSGRISKLGELARTDAKAKGQKYSGAVYVKQGGTPAKSNSGQAVSRMFEIIPGERQPWILCAKQGKAHETKEGLIVMDGKPECTIRVPLTHEKLKEFALAVKAAFDIWIQTRFVPVVMPVMQLAADRRNQAINQKKSASAAQSQGNYNR